jgi:hypothetical protein
MQSVLCASDEKPGCPPKLEFVTLITFARSVGPQCIHHLMAKHNQSTWRATRALVLGALLIGVNAALIWTLEHTDIVAFSVVLLFSSLSVFALSRLLWPTLSSTHHIDGQDSPTGRGEAEQPQDGLSHGLSGETGLEVLKSAADELSQWWPMSKRVNGSRRPDNDPTLIDRGSPQ